MPSRRTFASGILPSALSKETSLRRPIRCADRCPGYARFPTPLDWHGQALKPIEFPEGPLFFLRSLALRKKIFSRHAVEHHRHYRKSFSDEPVPHGEDRGIRLNIVEGLVESLSVSLPLAFFPRRVRSCFPSSCPCIM
jgi:hypothetical protein